MLRVWNIAIYEEDIFQDAPHMQNGPVMGIFRNKIGPI